MKAFAMLGLNRVGWIEKPRPSCGPLDAIVRPIAVSPCTSDVHTVFEGALGDRRDMILGHEAVGEVVEVGALVRDFRPGDRVIVTAITPDWGSLEAQRGYAMHSGGMLAGWKFSNFKDGVFAEFFHVNEADANLAHLPEDMEPGAAAMLCDMMPTGLHAAELAEVQFGEDVAVIGIGPVGLMAVAGCRLRGAANIYAVGTRVNYLGEGDHVKIPRAEWGCGMAHKQIRGGLMPGGRLRAERLAAMVETGRIDPSLMITHRFHGFGHIEEALLLMKNKPADLIKPVVYLD